MVNQECEQIKFWVKGGDTWHNVSSLADACFWFFCPKIQTLKQWPGPVCPITATGGTPPCASITSVCAFSTHSHSLSSAVNWVACWTPTPNHTCTECWSTINTMVRVSETWCSQPSMLCVRSDLLHVTSEPALWVWVLLRTESVQCPTLLLGWIMWRLSVTWCEALCSGFSLNFH